MLISRHGYTPYRSHGYWMRQARPSLGMLVLQAAVIATVLGLILSLPLVGR